MHLTIFFQFLYNVRAKVLRTHFFLGIKDMNAFLSQNLEPLPL